MSRGRKAKNKGVGFLLGLIILLVLLSVCGVVFLNKKNIRVTFQPAKIQLSNEELDNPYCGWYHTYKYQMTEAYRFEQEKFDEEQKADNNTRLVQMQFDLGNYLGGALPQQVLDELDKTLMAWSETDKKWLLCFSYETKPQDMSVVYLHMEQLTSLLEKYKMNIFMVQGFFEDGGFLEQDLVDYTSYLAALTDKEIFLSVENPYQYQLVTGNIPDMTQKMRDTESLSARLGIFDGAISKVSSEADNQRMAQICQYVPSGGIMGTDESLMEFSTAIETLKQRNVSFLSSDTPQGWLEKWKNETYREEDVFSGVTCYDYISAHLGYRYVLLDTDVSFDPWKEEKLCIKLEMENQGFSSCYHLFDTAILLKNTKTEEWMTFPLNQDNRTWKPQESVEIAKKIEINGLEKGEYKVFLLMMDSDSGEVIRLGNTMTMTSNGYLLGSMTIQ